MAPTTWPMFLLCSRLWSGFHETDAVNRPESMRLKGLADGGGPSAWTGLKGLADGAGPSAWTESRHFRPEPDAKSQKFPVVSSLTRLATPQQTADTSSHQIRISLTNLNRLRH